MNTTVEQIDDVLKEQGSTLETLRQCLVEYFGIRFAESESKPYYRRPPFALRLPHGDYVFVAKPTISVSGGIVTLTDGLEIESLRVLDDRHSCTVLNITVRPDEIRKTRWKCDVSLSVDAAENLVELSKFFLLFPDQVFARSKDRCCCCGKPLTDEQSRCRGIGPDCLKALTGHWRHWFVENVEMQEPVPQWRSVYAE